MAIAAILLSHYYHYYYRIQLKMKTDNDDYYIILFSLFMSIRTTSVVVRCACPRV